jgi:uncharacterized phage-associated protein
MLNAAKAAQLAAQFIQLEGGRTPHLKLIKLVYLADRTSIISHGCSITGDNYVSMPHGPVPSNTLNLVNGYLPATYWENLISDRDNHEVSLRTNMPPTDQLSQADLDIISSVWARFGHMDKFQLRDWTHDHLPEWQDPKGSSLPIPIEAILQAGNIPEQDAKQIAGEMRSFDQIDHIFARL